MTDWTIRVEWPGSTSITDAELGGIVDALSGCSPAVAIERRRGTTDATLSATISLEAGSPRQAIAAALQLVETAAGVRATGFEVLATDEHDRRAAEPAIPDLIGNAEIAELLGVTRQRVAQLDEKPPAGYPAAVIRTKAGPLRVREQVEAWASTWERRTGRPPRSA